MNEASSIGNLLLINNIITQDQLNEALIRQSREPHKRIGEILTEMNALDPEELPKLLKRQKAFRKYGARSRDVEAALEFAAENTEEVTADIDEMCASILKMGDDPQHK